MPTLRHLLLTLLLCSGLVQASQAEDDLALKVKAAYVFHLVKFVDWPGLPPDSLHICVTGSDAMSEMLGELANRQVKDRTLRIERGVPSDLAICQILFIGRAEKQWSSLLSRAGGLPVLTVSDLEDFARKGGVVGFYSEAGKIRLEINPDTARKAELRISAKLMEVARTVPAAQE